jgi:hypothetical protein
MTRMIFTGEMFPNSELEVSKFDEMIEISITNDKGIVQAVQITIADAEQLIDEIHMTISNIEDELKIKNCK